MITVDPARVAKLNGCPDVTVPPPTFLGVPPLDEIKRKVLELGLGVKRRIELPGEVVALRD